MVPLPLNGSALLDSWMPSYDVSARYAISVAAPPSQVYAALMATDFSRPWVVRGLMGLRLFPALLRSPVGTWRRLNRPKGTDRGSLSNLEGSDFILLAQAPPREIVVGTTGRFWSLTAEFIRIPPERFREPLPAGVAQAGWNFEITETPKGAELATETRVRCADPETSRRFRRYWRLVAPGSGLIRHAILSQVRRESEE
jgi:hypothetical protein